MESLSRRHFIRSGAVAATGLAALHPAIRRALMIPASTPTRSINDVEHIVVLMQENRSFDHYFGTMSGVRGFADRVPIPLDGGKPVWYQSDGERDITPFRLDAESMNSALIPSTPHNIPDAQAAWGQGRMSEWAKWKQPVSMGYHTRETAPFQWALAEAFTICDSHHCSLHTGTDPNRIIFWSGSNFNPELREQGINCTDTDAEFQNGRCWIEGEFPDPGYTYEGSSFRWPTIPDVLEDAGISWRIYQDPNDNWTGAMHGCLAFESFRSAEPGSPIYENGMSQWTLDDLAEHVGNDALPQVVWVLPSRLQSEHPGGPSSPQRGGDFTAQVLDALTSNADVWSKTAFFLTFDENDGLFDHVPPPAPHSFNVDGSPAGASTMDLAGMYLDDTPAGAYTQVDGVDEHYLDPDDTISGPVRPWGLGPRVPMYVVSPWSRGGWVASEVFDHTSVGQFIEQRFGVTIPAISPWHRSVCGDLTSAFDFENPNDERFPTLPDVSDYEEIEARSEERPEATPPEVPGELRQEPGVRPSRALPYVLAVDATVDDGVVALRFVNTGSKGAVFHVYDKLHLDRIPRRYTVEAGKELSDDTWDTFATDAGRYDLWVCSTNGFVRAFTGVVTAAPDAAALEATATYRPDDLELEISVANVGAAMSEPIAVADVYRPDASAPEAPFVVDTDDDEVRTYSLDASHGWYDVTLTAGDWSRRFAGRMETGEHGTTDPAQSPEPDETTGDEQVATSEPAA